MTNKVPPLAIPHVAIKHWHIATPPALTNAASSPFAVHSGNWLHFDGAKLTYHLTTAAKQAGVRILPFAQYAEHNDQQLQQLLSQIMVTNQEAAAHHVKIAQHAASGWVVVVPAGSELSDFTIEEQLTETTTHLSVGLVLCGAASRVSGVEYLTANSTAQGHAHVSRLLALAPDADVTYCTCDTLPAGVISYVRRAATLGKKAKLATHGILGNLGKTISALEVALRGPAAQAKAALVGVASGTATTSHTTQITNFAANTSGEIQQRAVAGARGQMIVNGIGQIVAGKDANAQQTSRMLMLSKQARGQVNPILLIDDNEVTAGHAASVGQVDQDQLFYLQSRGLPLPVAKHLLVTSFFKELLDKIPNDQLKQTGERLIEGQLMDFYGKGK